jgi:type IV secretion system protein VirB10
MIDEETGFEFSEEESGEEENREPEEESGITEESPEEFSGAEEEEGEEEPAQKKDAKEAVRFNKAPWMKRRLIIMAIAGAAAVSMVISIIGPGKNDKKKAADKAKAAPEVSVPDFGDYQGRAYRGGEEAYSAMYIEETALPYYEAPPEAPPPPAGTPAPSGGRNLAAEAEIAARGSSLVPPLQGRLLGMPADGGYTVVPVPSDTGLLSPEAYLQNRLSALGTAAPGGGAMAGLTGGGGNSSYETQNMQDNKQAFYSDGRDEVSGSYIAEDTIWNGTIIPAVLITGINTDLPGDVQARVTANIYDSLSGKKLLIPQGSILIASYNSSVSFAQERVQIAWNTLIRPDGYQVSLGNMNAVDRQGFSGAKGQVDEHLFQYLKAAGIVSLFTLLNGEISYNTSALSNNQSLQNLVAANQGVVNQLSAEVINRALDIQPTIRVKNGTQINVMVNQNIRFPPLKDYAVSGRYVRK